MLSDNDIHYVCGFLYIASGGDLTSVTLGEKIYDGAAEESRDVDIAVVRSAEWGIIAAEVKNHKRKLDVTVVEGICGKLLDMPTITKRAIVSASGYTKPAERKAAKHGVQCLSLVRGLPVFRTIDLSCLRTVKVEDTNWIDGPYVTLGPNVPLAPSDRALLTDDTKMRFPSFSITARQAADQIKEQFRFDELKYDRDGYAGVDLTCALRDGPAIVQLGNRAIFVSDARIRGVARRTNHELPLSESRFLSGEQGEAVAGVLLFELNRRLIGVTTSASRPVLRVFHIPEAVRYERPIRKRLI